MLYKFWFIGVDSVGDMADIDIEVESNDYLRALLLALDIFEREHSKEMTLLHVYDRDPFKEA